MAGRCLAGHGGAGKKGRTKTVAKNITGVVAGSSCDLPPEQISSIQEFLTANDPPLPGTGYGVAGADHTDGPEKGCRRGEFPHFSSVISAQSAVEFSPPENGNHQSGHATFDERIVFGR